MAVGATIAALVALLLVSTAIYVQFNPEAITRVFSTLLGPHPAAATREEVKESGKESPAE